MPRASQSSQSNLRKSSKKTTDEYDEQYDDLGDESVPTQGGSGRSSVSLLPEELQSLVNDTVYYLLIANQRNCPVKKQDIVKNVLKEKSKTFPLVIQKVKIILKQVFGMNLTELQGRPGLYLLLNDLDIKTEFSEHTLNWSEEENGKTGLLFFILSLIFMNGNVVVDNIMWTTLKRLGLDHDISSIPVYQAQILPCMSSVGARELNLNSLKKNYSSLCATYMGIICNLNSGHLSIKMF
ncbi:necdin, MAGE family member isoform X2 [Tachypleus tridentatus]|uniref:necdin, MAGE family member isoform X2 n=1 Tax=Tachypleus tridentatus TaxID=6853 RepID=UPI003FD6328E